MKEEKLTEGRKQTAKVRKGNAKKEDKLDMEGGVINGRRKGDKPVVPGRESNNKLASAGEGTNRLIARVKINMQILER